MALAPAQRIALIRESATLLDKQEWDDIDLILDQFGLPISFDRADTKSAYVINMIKRAADEDLGPLHAFLVQQATGAPASGQSPWKSEKLRLFCSHLAEQKLIVGQVADSLSLLGVEPFVAHDSIEPSKEWAQVIEAALAECDAMIAFMHQGFLESQWCDQEVGWALGRRRPILPLNYGIHPYGFLGKFQDQPCTAASPVKVADYVMDWLTKTPSLHSRLSHGLVDAFANSHSWDFTRRIAPFLEKVPSVTDDDLDLMEKAATENIDVKDCVVRPGLSGPQWVARYVSKRRGPTSPATWDSDEPPF